jgi:hypothetical protein
MLAVTVFPVLQYDYTQYGGHDDGVLGCSERMRHGEDGAAWSRCARIICSLPPKIEIAEAGKRRRPRAKLEAKSMRDRNTNLRHALPASSHVDITIEQRSVCRFSPVPGWCLQPVDLSKSVAIGILPGRRQRLSRLCTTMSLIYPQSGLEQHPCLLQLYY